MMRDFKQTGQYFDYILKTAEHPYTEEELDCAKITYSKLRDSEAVGRHPVMLFGKVQSGKTKNFTATIALCLDNDYRVVIILTKGTNALVKQTHSRMRSYFLPFVERDDLDVYA